MQGACTEHDFEPLETGQWRCRVCGLLTDFIEQCLSRGSVLDLNSDGEEDMNIALLRDFERPPEKKSKGTYVWRYHFNERIAQALLTGPGVPANIVAWLRLHYFIFVKQGVLPPPDEVQKRDIGELCHLTPVPEQFKYYYRSQAQKFNLFRTFSGYAERWYAVRIALGAPPFPSPTETQLYTLRLNAQKANNTWEDLRHSYQCRLMMERSSRCHITYNCRKNFPQIFYVLHQLCRLLGYDELLPLFPVDNQKKTLTRLNSYWKDICHALLWTYLPLPVAPPTRKRKVRPQVTRGEAALYTLRRRKKKQRALRFSRRKHSLEHQQLSPVRLPVKKRKGKGDNVIMVYDIGAFCVSRKMGESP